MQALNLKKLATDPNFFESIMRYFSNFHETLNMTSIQAIKSMVTVLEGLQEVDQKVSGLPTEEKNELLNWYSVYLYLHGIETQSLKLVFVRT